MAKTVIIEPGTIEEHCMQEGMATAENVQLRAEIKRLNDFCLNLISEEELFQEGGYETEMTKLRTRIKYLCQQRNKIWQLVNKVHVETEELINEIIQDNA